MHRCVQALIILALLSGCADQDDVRRQKWHDDLDSALQEARNLERGFVPHNAGVADSRLQTYRHQQIQELTRSLELLIREAPPELPTTSVRPVRRLLADYYASTARYELRAAVSAWTQIGDDTTVLLSQVISIERAASRAESLGLDEKPLVTRLISQKSEVIDQANSHRTKLRNARGSIDRWNEQIKKHEESKQQWMQQVDELHQQAYRAHGAEQLALYRQEADAKLQAAIVDRDIQLLDLERDLLQSNVRIDQKQVEMYEQTQQWLETQIIQSAQSQGEAKELQKEVLKERDALGKMMFDAFENVQADYTNNVVNQLDQAIAKADKAVGQKGVGKNLDQLTRHVTRLSIMADTIEIIGSYWQALDILVARGARHMKTHAESLQSTAADVRQSQKQKLERVPKMVEDATGLADLLIDGGDEQIKKFAITQKQHIGSYEQRIEESRLGD